MKDFFILIILSVVCFFSLNNVHFMSKTRFGESLGYFKSVSSVSVPPILANYLRNNNVRYAVYEIPNYVKDFLIYNKIIKRFNKNMRNFRKKFKIINRMKVIQKRILNKLFKKQNHKMIFYKRKKKNYKVKF